MAQQILKEIDGSFKSFFGLLKLAKQGKYAFRDCKLTHYLPKDGYTTLIIGFVRTKENKLIVPYSQSYKKKHTPITIKTPPQLNADINGALNILRKSNVVDLEVLYSRGELNTPLRIRVA